MVAALSLESFSSDLAALIALATTSFAASVSSALRRRVIIRKNVKPSTPRNAEDIIPPPRICRQDQERELRFHYDDCSWKNQGTCRLPRFLAQARIDWQRPDNPIPLTAA